MNLKKTRLFQLKDLTEKDIILVVKDDDTTSKTLGDLFNSSGGGASYELVYEFGFEEFNSNVGASSFSSANITVPDNKFIESAILVELVALDVDSIGVIALNNPSTSKDLFDGVIIDDATTLLSPTRNSQGSTYIVNVGGPFMGVIAGGNTTGQFKIFVKYGQIPN